MNNFVFLIFISAHLGIDFPHYLKFLQCMKISTISFDGDQQLLKIEYAVLLSFASLFISFKNDFASRFRKNQRTRKTAVKSVLGKLRNYRNNVSRTNSISVTTFSHEGFDHFNLPRADYVNVEYQCSAVMSLGRLLSECV